MQVSFGNFSKRRNSTKQPGSLSDVRDVRLKETTSTDNPTFVLTGDTFNYNYAQWGNTYYFINDIRSVHNNLIEVECVIDVLATYKAAIQASTQFVCYSSQSGGIWLPDTRIPILKQTQVSVSNASMGGLFNSNGFYVLSFVGKSGCELVCVNKSTLSRLVAEIQNWQDDGIQAVVNDDLSLGYDFSTIENALESLGKMSIQTGFIGNAFANAPNCIRSCIWVPFLLSAFSGGAKNIFLGDYDTTESGFELNATPTTGSVTVSIPWHTSDWRRGVCEDVYLYLPLVGLVSLSGDSLTHTASVTIEYSATGTDGVVCYRVIAGGEIIGTYGGQCSANYPIGINQQASAGQLVQSVISGGEKMVNAAINSSVSPISAGASVVGVALEGVAATYEAANVANTRNLSCVGGIGGGAGVGLSLDIACYTVFHPTIIAPSAMAATMGVPTMQPLALSGLTGFCQCANAHVEADAHAEVLDAIDSYLNSGFYIE